MKVVIIVQARMTSTRLPGKILKKVLGKPLLEIQLERLKRCTAAHEVVVATTERNTDDPVAALGRRVGALVVRGSEDDVLDRYTRAAEASTADVVVRVTSDCPLIDPAIIDTVIGEYVKAGDAVDYVSNTLVRSFPRGLDCEAFSRELLRTVNDEAVLPSDREHVTPFIYRQPERFRLRNVANASDQSRFRWTVDTPEDFELIRRMLEALLPTKPWFTLADCLQLMDDHPDWIHLNSGVVQKGLAG